MSKFTANDVNSRKRNRETSIVNPKNCRARVEVKAQSESRDGKTGYVEGNNEACVKAKHEINEPGEWGCVVYWMSHAFVRAHLGRNSGLLYAHQRAREMRKPLAVVLNVASQAPRGVVDMQSQLRKFGITLFLLKGNPMEDVSEFVRDNRAVLLVTDFSRSRAEVSFKHRVVAKVDCKIVEVDGHSVTAVGSAKPKIRFAARTIRQRPVPQLPKHTDEKIITQPVARPSKLLSPTLKAMDAPGSPSSIVGTQQLVEAARRISFK